VNNKPSASFTGTAPAATGLFAGRDAAGGVAVREGLAGVAASNTGTRVTAAKIHSLFMGTPQIDAMGKRNCAPNITIYTLGLPFNRIPPRMLLPIPKGLLPTGA